jgi:rare lipoprotein A (peptidoglycan hydrolase)
MSGYIIRKDGKQYRLRKDGKPDRRFKTSTEFAKAEGTPVKRTHSKPVKQSFNIWKWLVLTLSLALAILFIQAVLKEWKIAEEATPEVLTPVISQEMIYEPPTIVNENIWSGKASWYGEADHECLGCRADRLMANGERFNENARTVAFNRLPLGSRVIVTNLTNGESVEAIVTDTGGFEQLDDPRIIDLSKATAQLIGCEGLCQVKVAEVL